MRRTLDGSYVLGGRNYFNIIFGVIVPSVIIYFASSRSLLAVLVYLVFLVIIILMILEDIIPVVLSNVGFIKKRPSGTDEDNSGKL